jgi:hypothetical protein
MILFKKMPPTAHCTGEKSAGMHPAKAVKKNFWQKK